MITAAIIVLAVASQSFVSAQRIQNGQPDIKDVCENKTVEISSISQIKSLADQLKNGAECPVHIKAAIIDLDDSISVGSQDACTMDNMLMILDFVHDHLKKRKLPKSIETFALSYIMQTSQKCKINMINVLTKEADTLLKPADYAELAKWTNEGDDIVDLFEAATRTNFILPSHMAGMVLDDKNLTNTIDLDKSLAKDVHRIKMVCASRFKPIYEEVVLPIIALATTGIDYPDSKLKKELSLTEDQIDRLEQFDRIVYICEITDLLHDTIQHSDDDKRFEQIVYEPNSKVSVTDVRLLSADELAEAFAKMETQQAELKKLQHELYKTVVEELHEHLSPEDAALVVEMMECVKKLLAKLDQDEYDGAVEGQGKQVCNKPNALAPVISTIFVGGLIAFGLMLFGEA